MNNEMMYMMFANSVRKMDDAELEKTLEKAKSFLNENDYQKLVELIKKERQADK